MERGGLIAVPQARSGDLTVFVPVGRAFTQSHSISRGVDPIVGIAGQSAVALVWLAQLCLRLRYPGWALTPECVTVKGMDLNGSLRE